jgi:hypothetical protein
MEAGLYWVTRRRKWSFAMRKTLVSLTAAGALALGGLALPSPAQAAPIWLIPAIIAAGVGGAVVGGAAVAANRLAYGPPPGGSVYVRPADAAPNCQIMRERVPGGWRRVQVCN